MYLILYPSPRLDTEENYNSIFTTDMHRAYKCLNEKDVRIFKLDTLAEVKNIEVTYQEVVKEMT